MLERFQVHIRRFLTHGFTQQGIDQPDDGRIPFLLEQVLRLRYLLGQAHQVELLVQALRHLLGSTLPGAVSAGQQLAKTLVRHLLHNPLHT